jgi:hypothetical protein
VRRRAVIGSSSWVAALAAIAAIAYACACAKAPEARSNASTDSTVEPSADAGVASALSDVSVSEAGPDADARVPGLPMPQKFPHVVWDAAGAPRDAAASRAQ